MVNTPSSPEQPVTRRQRKELDKLGALAPTPPVAVAVEERPAPRAPVAPKPSLGKRILSWGTMIATPLLFIGVSLPVNIFYDEADMTPAIAGALAESDAASAQSFTVAALNRLRWGFNASRGVLPPLPRS
jgi:hypothetical protein